jgi:hypothetical protein
VLEWKARGARLGRAAQAEQDHAAVGDRPVQGRSRPPTPRPDGRSQRPNADALSSRSCPASAAVAAGSACSRLTETQVRSARISSAHSYCSIPGGTRAQLRDSGPHRGAAGIMLGAMSSDRKSGGQVRRPRAVERPQVKPGTLADLKGLI